VLIITHASASPRSALRRYRRKLNVRFLRPHHALFFSSPIFLGHHEKLPVAISARQPRVDMGMSLMERLCMVSNFSWCPLVILPPIDMVMQPKTCSTQALIADLRAPRKITGCDLGSAIPGRQGHEYHGTATHGFDFFVVPSKERRSFTWNSVSSSLKLKSC
jgi:hypothetical protein